MPSLLIIGTGRAAFHLGNAFKKAGVRLNGIVGRDPSRAKELASQLGTSAYVIGEELPNADVVLLAVSDDAITTVAQALPSSEAVVAHVSGARSLDALDPHKHQGVLWPIQTLGVGTPIDLSNVPMIVDGNTDHAKQVIWRLGQQVSTRVSELGHAQRQRVHLAAVLTSNLPVFLVREGQRLLKESKLPTDLLGPLWETTAARVADLGPERALTGPARRGDERTIEQHLALLANDPELQEAYAVLSKLILKAYGH